MWKTIDLDKYQDRFEASRKRVRAAMNFEEGDCVATHASVAGSYYAWLFGVNIRDYYTDIDTQIEVQMRGIKWRLDNIPDDRTDASLYYDAGPVGEAVAWNAPIEYPDNTSPRIPHFVMDAKDIEKLEPIDPRDNPAVAAFLRRGQEFADRAKALGVNLPAHYGMVGIHPPLSCACAIAPPDLVYYLMAADPDLVRILFEKCYRQFVMLKEYALEVFGGNRDALGLADDNCSFVSKAMYDEQVLPWNKALWDEYGRKYRSLHSDGPHHQHCETYAKVLHLNHVDIGGWSRLQPAVEILKPARCVVHGNMNNRDLYAGWTETLKQKIRNRIRLAAPGGGYVFAIGGETYAGTDPDVLCRTFEYAHEVGRYPIDLPEEEWLEEVDRPFSLAER
ncbi:MAG: hypothetical protein HPY44_07785 [Armatimonadetes bacterium]|nr:hypothetical protein [Armatimonadota bacterium]